MANTGKDGRKRMKKRGQMAEAWARMKTQPIAVVSLAVVAVLVLVAIFADLIVPYSKAITQVASDKLLPPGTAGHILGFHLRLFFVFLLFRVTRAAYGS